MYLCQHFLKSNMPEIPSSSSPPYPHHWIDTKEIKSELEAFLHRKILSGIFRESTP